MGGSPRAYWNGGTTHSIPTADASAKISFGGSDCGADYILNFALTPFDSVVTDVGNVRHIAISKSPRSGYYWRVLQMDALDSDTATQQSLEFALAPADGLPSTNGADPLSTTLVDAYKRLGRAIRIGMGSSHAGVSGLTDIASANSSFASPTQLDPVIVPPGWCLIAFEVNTAVSASVRRLTLRVLYVEVPVGVEIPF